MVKDLNLDVKIKVLPIVRDKNGLALSSRNTYLSPAQRKAALSLSSGLKEAERMISKGERKAEKIIMALSSRNAYLSPAQRKAALSLSSGLKEAERMISKGERKAEKIITRIREIIEKEPLAHIDYVEMVELEELNPITEINQDA